MTYAAPFASAAAAPLAAVLYRSTATQPLGAFEASGAGAEFAERNRARGLSGYLHLEDGRFFQYLEGAAGDVARLWGAIRRDPRHREVTELSHAAIPVRRFAGWAMGAARGPGQSLYDWSSRSGLSLKGRGEPQVLTAFLEYASGAARREA